MSKKQSNPRNQVVFSDDEIKDMQKYLADILHISMLGNCPEYEINKIASILNFGGETVENYMDRVKL